MPSGLYLSDPSDTLQGHRRRPGREPRDRTQLGLGRAHNGPACPGTPTDPRSRTSAGEGSCSGKRIRLRKCTTGCRKRCTDSQCGREGRVTREPVRRGIDQAHNVCTTPPMPDAMPMPILGVATEPRRRSRSSERTGRRHNLPVEPSRFGERAQRIIPARNQYRVRNHRVVTFRRARCIGFAPEPAA